MAVVQDAAHKMHAAEGIGQARDIVYNNSKEQAKMYFGVTPTDEAGIGFDPCTNGVCACVWSVGMCMLHMLLLGESATCSQLYTSEREHHSLMDQHR